MAFFEQAITVLQTLVIALGAGLGIWGVINPVSYTHLDVYKRQDVQCNLLCKIGKSPV